MRTFYFTTEQLLQATLPAAWDFFSAAGNLSLITPPEMDFKTLTQLDGRDIYEGMIIDYKVKPLFGIPMHWQTKISKVQKPFSFTDIQLKGPYRCWEHTHTFIEKENGVFMKDEVKYELPFGILGAAVQALIVRKKIQDLFIYRKAALERIFAR
jgi:ligand-binding SRPBCC domain-containing protein